MKEKYKVKKHIRFFRMKPMLVFVTILSFSFFLGTFAWFTSSDSITNSFSGSASLVAEIDEVYAPNTQWKPGESTKKEVRVENTGDVDAFVRVSLYEFLLLFKVDSKDKSGNGNLKTVDTIVTPVVDAVNTSTWDEAAKNSGTYSWFDKNYVADTAIVPDIKEPTQAYQYQDVAREDTLLSEITLFLGQVVTEVPANSNGRDYWLYEDGYFYYSRPLKPKEKSDLLLTHAVLNEEAPNKYKGSLYKVKVFMDAHDLTVPVFESWNISKTSQAYKLLQQYTE